jgi:actin-like ATPase involved in cell morphogenesis
MFKSLPIHIIIKRNYIQVINLETGTLSSISALNNFSSVRNVIGNFNYAEETIKAALNELNIKNTFFSRPLTILIQQTEGLEGGLSDIEKRALRDLAEMAGGKKVFISEDPKPLAIEEALLLLKPK